MDKDSRQVKAWNGLGEERKGAKGESGGHM